MPLTVNITQFEGGVTAYQNTTAEGVSNYLIWLCGKFGLEAQDIISHTPINSATQVQPFTSACAEYQLYGAGRGNPITIFSYVPCGQTTAVTVILSDTSMTVSALINSVRILSGSGTFAML